MTLTLDGVDSTVGLHVRVPADYSFDRFHDVIQIAFGWRDMRPHHFEIGTQRFAELPTDLVDADPGDYADEAIVRLDDFLPEVLTPFRYEYSPADQWTVIIAIERTVQVAMGDPKRDTLTCLDGGGACPPEDVRGPAEYLELLEAFDDFTHDRYREAKSTLGSRYKPTAFRRWVVNDLLAQYRRRTRVRLLETGDSFMSEIRKLVSAFSDARSARHRAVTCGPIPFAPVCDRATLRI